MENEVHPKWDEDGLLVLGGVWARCDLLQLDPISLNPPVPLDAFVFQFRDFRMRVNDPSELVDFPRYGR